MQSSQTFNWLQYASPPARSIDIKIEPSYQDSALSLLSPPSSPSLTRSAPNPPSLTRPSPLRRRSNTTLTNPKRPRPYPPTSPHEHRFRGEGAGRMSHQPFPNWSASGSRGGNGRPLNPAERRSSDGDQLAPYALSHVYDQPSFPTRSDRSTPPSSSSMTPSSLTGAIAEASLASNPSRSDSLSPKAEQPYGVHMHSPAVIWTSPNPPMSVPPSQAHYSSDSSHGNLPYHTLSPTTSSIGSTAGAYPHYHDYNASSYANQSSETVPPSSPGYASFTEQFGFQQSRAQPVLTSRPIPHTHYTPTTSVSPPSQPNSAGSTEEKLHEEIRQLHKKIRELELINESARLRVRGLESEITNEVHYNQTPSTSIMGGLPSPLSTPSPQSATFQASWKARTDARIKHFCSLNRAGNALCAWHDSRRERRAFPPRMAPPGQLNCGCTHEEALFEESLARHGVGSYHPGETVRMDPALRNPLLKLLQARYGYKDGEFERDPTTGEWIPGEGHAFWEQRAQAATNSRRSRGDIDRR